MEGGGHRLRDTEDGEFDREFRALSAISIIVPLSVIIINAERTHSC